MRIALAYSSRESIVRAVARFGAGLPPSVATFDRWLTESLSDSPLHGGIDLLLRSGGEKRLSDFLLWDMLFMPNWCSTSACGSISTAQTCAREHRFGGIIAAPRRAVGGV